MFWWDIIRYRFPVYLTPYPQSPQEHINEPARQPPYLNPVGQAPRDDGRSPSAGFLLRLNYWRIRDVNDIVWEAIPEELSLTP